MNTKKYNLFLDDLRVPYIDPIHKLELTEEQLNFASAYQYSNFAPFKDERWAIVRDYNQFVEYINKYGLPKLIAFDHDLADVHYTEQDFIAYSEYHEKTGFDADKWLCNYCQDNGEKFPDYIVHSWNPVGKENIEKYIENYKKHIEDN